MQKTSEDAWNDKKKRVLKLNTEVLFYFEFTKYVALKKTCVKVAFV